MKRAAVALVAVGALVALSGGLPYQMARGDSEIAMGDLVALADQLGVTRKEGERYTLADILQYIAANQKSLEAKLEVKLLALETRLLIAERSLKDLESKVVALETQLAAAQKTITEVGTKTTLALSKADSATTSATKAQQTADQALARANSASTAASSAQQTAASALAKSQSVESQITSVRDYVKRVDKAWVDWSWDHYYWAERELNRLWDKVNRCCR